MQLPTMSSIKNRRERGSTFIIREDESPSAAIARAVCTMEGAPIDERAPLYYTVGTKASRELPDDIPLSDVTKFNYQEYQIHLIGVNLLEVWK
jgi:hypothetical protein